MAQPWEPYNMPPQAPPPSGTGGNPYAPVPASFGQPPLPDLPSGLPVAPRSGGPSASDPFAAPLSAQDMAARNKRVSPKTAEEKLMDQLQAFFDELNKPFDPNDPEVQIILQNMRANTLQDAGNRGIYGGYSQNLANQAMARASAGMALQKKGMAANALGMLTGATQNQRDFNYGKAKDDYQAQMDQWKQEQDKNLDLWKLGGGVVGGLVGGIGGALATGGPGAIPGAAAGWGLGSNLGGAIGGNFSSPAPQWRPPGGY